MSKEQKPIATSKSAGRTDGIKNSLIKCEVSTEKGEWKSPPSCSKIYINEDAEIEKTIFEIITDQPAPYSWEWEIKWVVQSCPQAKNKNRFPPKKEKTYREGGKFESTSPQWECNLNGKIIGGDLTVKVKAGNSEFIRKVFIRGKEPGEAKINAYIETKNNKTAANIAKKIFKQESNFKHFYTDEIPLVSFDNGYGLGQATSPPPSYEQAWDWKKHTDYIIDEIIQTKLASAKKYLGAHEYTNEHLETETLVAYNGANHHYYIWGGDEKIWIINPNILCDPSESNKGWNLTKQENTGKTIDELKTGKNKPIYTGKCYAEHIKKN